MVTYGKRTPAAETNYVGIPSRARVVGVLLLCRCNKEEAAQSGRTLAARHGSHTHADGRERPEQQAGMLSWWHKLIHQASRVRDESCTLENLALTPPLMESHQNR